MTLSEQIVLEYTNGATIKDLKAKYHKGYLAIKEILEKAGVFRSRFLTEDEKKYILEQYKKGKSINELSKELKRKFEAISKYLHEVGAFTSYDGVIRKLENREEFLEDYQNGKSLQFLSEKYSLHKSTVKIFLKKSGIVPRNHFEQVQISNRNYTYDKNFFDGTTSDCWYMVGFIAADGYVGKNHKALDITIHQKDGELLEKFCKKISYTGKVKHFMTSKAQPRSRITINSRELCLQLEQYNIVNNKTLIYEMPEIPTQFLGDFLRGYFDGDGWVAEDGSQVSIVTASKSFYLSLLELYKKLGIEYNVYFDDRHEHRVYDVRITRQEYCKKFFHLLYDNIDENSLYLPRKYDRFSKILK